MSSPDGQILIVYKLIQTFLSAWQFLTGVACPWTQGVPLAWSEVVMKFLYDKYLPPKLSFVSLFYF